MEITASLISSRPEALTGASVAAAPNAAATQQFAALMQAPAAEAIATASAAAASTQAVTRSPAVTGNFGEKILNGMQNVSDEIRGNWTRVSDMLAPRAGELGMREMLDVQRHVALMSMQMDMFGKVTSNAVQSIEKTVRVQ